MRKLVFILILLLAFVLESKIRFWGISPNLTVLIAYYVGLRLGPRTGLLSGAGIGVLSDSISAGIMGPSLLGKSTAGYLSAFLRGGMFNWTPVLGLIAVFVLTALDGFIAYSSSAIFSEAATSASHAAGAVLLQAALNSIFGLFITPGDED